MRSRLANRFLLFCVLSFCTIGSLAQVDEGRYELVMRLIGHEILLDLGDSTSRVLPIEKYGDEYQIHFDTDFAFSPEKVANIVDSVISVTAAATAYRVEVSQCGPGKIVYSYEIGGPEQSDLVPCGTRGLPLDCYYLSIRLFEMDNSIASFHMDVPHFNAESVMATIDSVVKEKKMGRNYEVQIEKCPNPNAKAGHSLGKGVLEDSAHREVQKKDCPGYLVTISNTESAALLTAAIDGMDEEKNATDLKMIGSILVIALLVLGLAFWLRRRFQRDGDPHVIVLGKYEFDQRKMELRYGKEKVELTSKESDLLSLLHESANHTLEREAILRVVWGDEGDYVGRTLDVFISKLRKKLGADANVKIVNVRGVGYKLILDV